MSNEGTLETPVSRAIKRRKELEELVRSAMQELDRIEQFLKLYREFAAPDDSSKKGVSPGSQAQSPSVGRLYSQIGQAQPVFEQFARQVLREVQRPLTSAEMIEEFKKRGHPIAGNETRTAWNRLWKARKAGVLINIPKFGYWLADEPLPPLPAEPPKRAYRPAGQGKRHEWVGRPRGRTKVLTEAQVKLAEEWIIEGKKSIKEICADLGGISTPAYYTYFPGGRNALLAKRFGIEAPKIVRAPRGQGKPYVRSGRPARRPLKLSTEQVERAKSLRAEARTFDQVAAELGVSVSTVRRALARG